MILNNIQKTNKYLKLKRETAKLFNSKCIGCEKKYDHSFVFHHLQYIGYEKIYSDSGNTTDCNPYICPIIQKDCQRFRLVCCTCHSIIEQGKENKLAVKFFNEINNGSLDNWETTGLDAFLGLDEGVKYDN